MSESFVCIYNIEAVSSCKLFFFPIFPIRILTVDSIFLVVPDRLVFSYDFYLAELYLFYILLEPLGLYF